MCCNVCVVTCSVWSQQGDYPAPCLQRYWPLIGQWSVIQPSHWSEPGVITGGLPRSVDTFQSQEQIIAALHYRLQDSSMVSIALLAIRQTLVIFRNRYLELYHIHNN